MLASEVYFVDFSSPDKVGKSPHQVALVCTWELEVIIHERQAWIEHILAQANEPEMEGYLNDVLN